MHRSLIIAAIITLALLPTGCSNRAAHHQLAKRIDESEARLQDELDKIKRTVEASYQRERAMAERLQLAEEANARLRQELLEQEEQIRQLGSPSRDSGTFSADDSYRRAKARYDDGGYERALTGFAEILSRAPRHALADNAQYWVGECHYGLGRYRHALTEFAKVFIFSETEKADDAQLKIGLCYRALGEKDHAIAAFRKLLTEYPGSEFTTVAGREVMYLEGP